MHKGKKNDQALCLTIGLYLWKERERTKALCRLRQTGLLLEVKKWEVIEDRWLFLNQKVCTLSQLKNNAQRSEKAQKLNDMVKKECPYGVLSTIFICKYINVLHSMNWGLLIRRPSVRITPGAPAITSTYR